MANSIYTDTLYASGSFAAKLKNSYPNQIFTGKGSTYLTDNQKWPQVPAGTELDSPEEGAWWRTTLAPYGMGDKTWSCPTLRRLAREKNMEAALKENHYVPSLFDEFPATPFRWPKIPWAMEVGNNHGTGLLLIMMDGSIQPYEEFHNNARR